MPADRPSFDLSFLDTVAWVTLAAAVGVGVVGYGVTRDIRFGIACVVAATADISLVFAATRRARRSLDAGLTDPLSSVLMVAGRLVIKGGLLLVAALFNHPALFWGTVAGAVAFDVTLATAGSAIALTSFRRHTTEGR